MNTIDLLEFTDNRQTGADFESGGCFVGTITGGQKLYMRSQSKIIDLENGNELDLSTVFDNCKIVTVVFTTKSSIDTKINLAKSQVV